MKRKRRLLLVIIFFVIVGIVGYCLIPKHTDIQEVLKTKEYDYLPVEAKNYIEKIYEIGGEVPYTEKNKKENTPYLNPQYIEYLTLSDEEKQEVEEIPDVYRIDYTSEEIIEGAPSSYDLRNVNGKNFLTPVKNQGNLDLCWSMTSTEQAESLLLKNSNTSYSSGNSVVFSTRQLDYALSFAGITHYENDFGVRPLTYGGNYFMAAIAMSNGVGLISESAMPWNETTVTKKLSDVLNYQNSLYELDQSIMMPSLTNPTTSQLNSYVSKIKDYVQTYGGVYVATQAPNRSCASTNSNGTIIIRPDANCSQNSSHAMQIIGWDDSYSYSYCASNGQHTSNTSSCSGTVVSGTGAWLLRNSWGSSSYPYVWLAYDSLNYDIRLTKTLSDMSTRTWDNNYHQSFDNYYVLTTSSDAIYFQKPIDTKEKIEKIKVYIYGENGKYTLSISSSKEAYRKIKTISVPTAGLYTIDLHDQNVVITDSGFNVELLATSDSQAYFVKNSISVFTSNVDAEPTITSEEVHLKPNSSSNYQFTLYSHTKAIPSNSSITYTLKNGSNTNYSSYLSVTNNLVAKNDVNAEVTINKSIPTGTYYLTTSFNTYSYQTKVVIGNPSLSGSGTVSSPYLINSESELRMMANDLSAHYKLNHDITLTSDWEPIGTKETPFTGSLNGNGYQIINLKVSKGNDYNGLFGYVIGNTNSTTSFKNITLVNPQIDGSGDSGALIGKLTAAGDYDSYPTINVTIDNIVIQGGHVYSYFGNSGALIGSIFAPINLEYGYHTYTINRIFNSSSVGATQSSGLIGYVLGSSDQSVVPTINLTHIDNVGDMDYSSVRTGNTTFFSGCHGAIFGYVLNYVNINLKYYVSTVYYRNYAFSGDGLIGTASPYATISKNNGYSVLNTSISNMKTASNYSTWSNFDNYWTMSTVDGVTRIPVLKSVSFPYTKFETISLKTGDEVYLSDYLVNYSSAMLKLNTTANSNSSVVTYANIIDSKTNLSYDTKITAVGSGTTNLTVQNAYDGFVGTITITVDAEETAEILYFKNDGTGAYRTQTVTVGATVNLMANPFTRTGYTFTGWNTKADGSGTAFTDQQAVIASTSATLYAQWSPITYTITYRANGGSGSMSNTNATYDVGVTLRSNTFTRDGYTFTGWNTKADGSGTSYTNGQSVLNLTTTNNATITLYAQWRSNSQTGGYEITGYTYDDTYIDDVTPNTSVASFKNHITVTGSYTVEVTGNSGSIITTGSKTTIYNGTTKVKEYINIVRGDPSGDGAVNSADLLKIVKHLKNTNVMNATQKRAADCNFDGNINSADLLKIVKYLKGTGTIQR